MQRIISLAAAVIAMSVASGTAAAQSWGFGVGMGFGEPDYYGPPPGYSEPPVIFEAVPEAGSEGAPIDVAPDGRPVFQMESPDDVLDALDGAGYRELSPMHMRGHSFVLAAVDPRGDLVQIELSIFTGEIERITLLQAGYLPPVRQRSIAAAPQIAPAPPQVSPAPPPPAVTPPPRVEERVVPPPQEQDPLVVY